MITEAYFSKINEAVWMISLGLVEAEWSSSSGTFVRCDSNENLIDTIFYLYRNGYAVIENGKLVLTAMGRELL